MEQGSIQQAELVGTYHPQLIRYFMGYVRDMEDAQDLSQETLLKAIGSLSNLRKPEALNAWIYRIAHNVLISFYRKRRIHTESNTEVVNQVISDPNQDPEQQMIWDETQRELFELIRTLPESIRQAFLLREVSGLSYKEIARIQRCRLGTVQSRIFRAREMLLGSLRTKGIEL
jgi:RNA polymerase sigma-70 factor, ECF subfamily